MQEPWTQESFTKVYDEHVDAIFRFLCVRLNDRERARELTQETFMRAWIYLQQGRTITHMKAFLYTTANNLFKNELRAKRDTVSLDMMMEETAFEPNANMAPPEDQIDGKALLARIKELKESYGEVLTLRYVDGLTVGEIARVLGETPINTSVRLHRALSALRKVYNTPA
jgi:RNA polymerase sigma-70 factor, ECF subfamily